MKLIYCKQYLADWVATMVLIQSKLKWRARILEKFIHIAYQLRLLENFDSLMGVLAGLNSQPVFRLAETMETVNLKLEGDRTKIPKRLRSLNKLMATTKSFAAYRLALANSGTEMLPYLSVSVPSTGSSACNLTRRSTPSQRRASPGHHGRERGQVGHA